MRSHANPINRREEVIIRKGHPRAYRCSLLGVLWHQPGRVVDLVQVLVDYVRFVERRSVDSQHRDLTVGADAQELLALVAQVDLVYLEVDPLLVQHHPSAHSVGSMLSVVELRLHRIPPPRSCLPPDGSSLLPS